jgi:hypothetical protein
MAGLCGEGQGKGAYREGHPQEDATTGDGIRGEEAALIGAGASLEAEDIDISGVCEFKKCVRVKAGPKRAGLRTPRRASFGRVWADC